MTRLWEPKENYESFDAHKSYGYPVLYQKEIFLPYVRRYKGLDRDELISLIQDARRYRWQALDLSNCGLTELPDALWDLPDLRMLYLGNDFRSKDPPNGLTDLPRDMEHLKNLQVLSLEGQRIRMEENTSLNLPNLVCLDLNGTGITQLPDCAAKWTNLRVLYLSRTGITQLPDCAAQWTNLKVLFLSGTGITRLPDCAAQWSNLEVLYLSETGITQLPDCAAKWTNLVVLELSATPLIKKLPPEAQALGGQDLLRYILKTQSNAQRKFFHESKLVIVGQAQVGKSSLLKRLVHGTFTPEKPSTEGIQIEPWRFKRNGEEYRLNIWDFGGQEIYHSTHQFFLTEQTLYLLVWDALSEDEHGRVDYWLRTIQSRAGDNPIFIVINKCDDGIGRVKRVDWDDYHKRYPQIEGVYDVSCKDGRNINDLRDAIQTRAIKLPLMKKQWFSEWLRARTALETRAKTENHISYNEFCEICEKHGVSAEDIPTLAKCLHNLGIIMYYHDDVLLRNMVILSSEWGTDAVYKILDQQERRLKGRNGILYADRDLKRIWNDKKRYPSEYYPHLLNLMEKFQLAFRIDPNTYLIAELLESQAIERKDLPFAFGQTLSFRYDYDFMPAGIMTRFIVAAHEYLDTVDGVKQCWRKGAYLRDGATYARVVLCDSVPNRHILIQVSGGSPRERRELLTYIRKTLGKVNSPFEKLVITQMIPCICSEGCEYAFEYAYLLKAEAKGRDTVECQKSVEAIKLRKLLDGVEDTMPHRHHGIDPDLLNRIKEVVPDYGKSEVNIFNNHVDNSVNIEKGTKIENSSIGSNTNGAEKEGFFKKHLWPIIAGVLTTIIAAIILYYMGID